MVNGRVTEQDYIDAANDLGVEIVDEPIQIGDLYLAGRNTGIHLLTCESVDPRSWIVSTEPYGYSYDTWECKLVREIKHVTEQDYTHVTEQDYIDTANDLGVEIVDEPIQIGDLYLAGRTRDKFTSGIYLLTCKSLYPGKWIVPEEAFAHSFDTGECKKVRKIES